MPAQLLTLRSAVLVRRAKSGGQELNRVRTTRSLLLLTAAQDALRSHPDIVTLGLGCYSTRIIETANESGFDGEPSPAGCGTGLLPTLRTSGNKTDRQGGRILLVRRHRRQVGAGRPERREVVSGSHGPTNRALPVQLSSAHAVRADQCARKQQELELL